MDVDLDDTHLCIKCNATIVGIDAYVLHRRRNCIAKADQITGRLVSNEHHTFTAFEYPDDESTAKPDTPKPYTLTFVNDTTKSPHAHDASRVENYDCELGADIFFSSLELQSSSKTRQSVLSAPPRASGSRSRTRKTTGSSHDVDQDDWIHDAHPADGSAQLMKAVRDISGHRKPDTLFQMIRLSQDSPFSFGDDDEDDDEEQVDDENHSDEEQVPPPSYTKGKWVPGTKISRLDYKTEMPAALAINDKFRCRVCDRSLCNEAAYTKHLKSELHIKRSMPEHELDLGSRPVASTIESKIRLVRTTNEDSASKQSSPESIAPPLEVQTSQKTRLRRHIYIKCEICQSRLAKHLHGKHLISQFHYRRMCKLNRPYDHLLPYMPAIVQQCPFQCHPCRFYANTEAQFLRHWNSPEHASAVEISANGPFWCSFCKFQCGSNSEMGLHLGGTQHQELLQALDRSVPIIIRKMSTIYCSLCNSTFQFNAQLRDHSAVCSSDLQSSDVPDTSASDAYQSKFRCEMCPTVLRSRKAYQMHSVSVHNLQTYFCSICSLNFASAKKARAHRTSTEHKVKSAHLRKRANMSRDCRVCGVTLSDVVELREHLSQQHPTDKHGCTYCGALFELQQELSRHIRDKACANTTQPMLNSGDHSKSENMYCCEQCNFSTLSKSEHIFHVVLHDYPDTSETPLKIPCPICRKPFFKTSLRMHLRQHTDERPNECKRCGIAFARKANLRAHVKLKHTNTAKRPPSTVSSNVEQSDHSSRHLLRPHFHCHRSQVTLDTSAATTTTTRTTPPATVTVSLCTASVAQAITDTKASGGDDVTSAESFPCASSVNDNDCLLDDHGDHDGLAEDGGCGDGDEPPCVASAAQLLMVAERHSSDRNGEAFVCDIDACSYRGKTKKALTRHLKVHTTADVKTHNCQLCTFKSRFPGHLKRHLLVHSGEKPYKCPHCDYSCNNSENLRKHVLSTRLHPGRSLYECHQCALDSRFTSNYFKDYKEHIVRVHTNDDQLLI